RGTPFQLKVWEALLRLPPGRRVSYTQLATLAGQPRAQRAVGSALAANTIAYLIPCHRVIRESGESGHYRWGDERKSAMLAWEVAHTPSAPEQASRAPEPARRLRVL
ncbi:MAG: MGMT family protein, partial [Curvibacter sp.]